MKATGGDSEDRVDEIESFLPGLDQGVHGENEDEQGKGVGCA